ncbi:MAG: glycosyltransferase family 4 protein [Lachnospiraceae bacterium]
MKVLMINKFFYIKGGSETYYFTLKTLLEQHGHQVIDFSMKDPHNYPSPYQAYFVEGVDYNGKSSIPEQLKMASRIIYSKEAMRKLDALIAETKPDIAHLHIFQHQMSPSILAVLKKHRIPIVYTAHDLKMLCPNYKMLNRTGVCERCKGHHYYHCVQYRCIKDSMMKSMICMLEGYLHLWLKSYDAIDAIITPSRFYYDQFLSAGIEPKRLHYLPNAMLDMQNEEVCTQNEEVCQANIHTLGTYYLYLGRISSEKGILTMIQGMQDTGATLYIAGTGPQENEIKTYLAEQKITNVTLLGFKQQPELQKIVLHAKAVIIPSEWYENSPYSGIEALSLGRIMIGAKIGGIPELIQEGENGYLFPPGDAEAMRDCILNLEHRTADERYHMQVSSRRLFETKFTQQIHYDAIETIYRNLSRQKERDN